MRHATNDLSSTRALAFIEGLEGFFQDDIAAVSRRLRDSHSAGPREFNQTRISEFMHTYASQYHGVLISPATDPTLVRRNTVNHRRNNRMNGTEHLNGLTILEPGDIRPLVRLRVGDGGSWGNRHPGNEAKTALLYAPQIVLMDPLPSVAFNLDLASNQPKSSSGDVSWLEALNHFGQDTIYDRYHQEQIGQLSAELEQVCEGLEPEEWVTRVIEQYASLAPAIRSGLIESVSVRYENRGPFELSGIGELEARDLQIQTGRRDPVHIQALMRHVLLQITIAAQAPGIVNPLAAPGLEERVLTRYLRRLYAPTRKKSTIGDARARDALQTIQRLLSLDLPGVDFTKIRDLVQVRDDEVFANVREDIRTALSAANYEATLEDAQAVATETFQSRRRTLTPSFSSALKAAILPGSVGFGVGTAVDWAGRSWQPMLELTATGAMSAAIAAHKKKARRAQRAIYAALSMKTPS